MKRDFPRFYLVLDEHVQIHDRLENWGMWCQPGHVGRVQPMFRLYRPDNWHREVSDRVIDILDAQHIQKCMHYVPDKPRRALNWYYVDPGNPRRQAQQLGLNVAGLFDLLASARTMMRNIARRR